MIQAAFQSNPVQPSGDLPQVGNKAPELTSAGSDLSEAASETFAGKKVVYSTFPSIDTGIRTASVRHFNEDTVGLDNIVVVNVSRDLPLALGRSCITGGLDNVGVAPDLRHDSGEIFDAVQQDGPPIDLLARVVITTDGEGKVIYNQLVDEITTESDYDSVLAAPK